MRPKVYLYYHKWNSEANKYIHDSSPPLSLGWSTGPQCKTLGGCKRSLSRSVKSGGYLPSAEFSITAEYWLGGPENKTVFQAWVKE